MQTKVMLMVVLLIVGSVSISGAQKRKKVPTSSRSKIVKAEATKPIAPTLGTTVHILTKNGDKLSGELVDLTAYSVRYKANNLESTLPLESLASVTFGAARQTENKPEPTFSPVREVFRRDAAAVSDSFQSMAIETKGGSSYTDYDRQLMQLRRETDRFIQKYCTTENPTEARAVALMTGALIDYNAARAIWTLKIGTKGMLAETDAPVVGNTLAIYPDLRTTTASGDKFSADKLIGNLWKKASEKVNLVQAMVK